MTPLIAIMERILADSYAVYLKTQNYHWNVVSQHAFYALHKLFEEQYQELSVGIDDIAEKIRQLGSLAPASFKDYERLSDIEAGDPSAKASAMVQDLARDQEKLMRRLQEGIAIATKDGDDGTVDLLVARWRVHDKNKWMLQSSV